MSNKNTIAEPAIGKAVERYWEEINKGNVRSGKHMEKIEDLFVELAKGVGGEEFEFYPIRKNEKTEQKEISAKIPGYFRAEKTWDMVVLYKGQLVAAVEFKGQSSSTGKNINSRVEEAIGSSYDAKMACKNGLYRNKEGLEPFFGFFLLIEDCVDTRRSVVPAQRLFETDAIFRSENGRGTSYKTRYKIMCDKFVESNIYNAACLIYTSMEELTESDGSKKLNISYEEASPELSINNFAQKLVEHIEKFKSGA